MSGFAAVTWDGWEKYNALALTFTQRLWKGLVVNSVYTFSKAFDDASNPGADNAEPNFPQDPSNIAAEGGLSDFDHRHRFVTNFLYDLPFLKASEGWMRTAFGGWRVGGIWILQGLNLAWGPLARSFMQNDRQWAVYGSLLAIAGLGMTVWAYGKRGKL